MKLRSIISVIFVLVSSIWSGGAVEAPINPFSQGFDFLFINESGEIVMLTQAKTNPRFDDRELFIDGLELAEGYKVKRGIGYFSTNLIKYIYSFSELNNDVTMHQIAFDMRGVYKPDLKLNLPLGIQKHTDILGSSLFTINDEGIAHLNLNDFIAGTQTTLKPLTVNESIDFPNVFSLRLFGENRLAICMANGSIALYSYNEALAFDRNLTTSEDHPGWQVSPQVATYYGQVYIWGVDVEGGIWLSDFSANQMRKVASSSIQNLKQIAYHTENDVLSVNLILNDGKVGTFKLHNGTEIVPFNESEVLFFDSFIQEGVVTNYNGEGQPFLGGLKFTDGISGFGSVSNVAYQFWGYYHHKAVMELVHFLSTPIGFSFSLHDNITLDWSAVGDGVADIQMYLTQDTINFTNQHDVFEARRLVYGQDNFTWTMTGLSAEISDGDYFFRARVEGSDGSQINRYTPIRFDRNGPVGAPDFSRSSSEDETLLVDGAYVISDKQGLKINFESVLDEAPFAEEVCNILFSLRNEITHAEYQYSYRKVGASIEGLENPEYVLYGYSFGGVELPNGLYSLNVSITDSLGNHGYELQNNQEFLVTDQGSFSQLYVQHGELNGDLSTGDMLLTDINNHETSVRFSIYGEGNTSVWATLLVDGEQITSLDYESFSNTELNLVDGEYHYEGRFEFSTLETGSHTITLGVIDENNLTLSLASVIVVNEMQVVISYPNESTDDYFGTVQVEGIATAPHLNRGDEGFSYYKAYYAEGHVALNQDISSAFNLMSAADWQPFMVPPSIQNHSTEANFYNARFDALWPESNIGISDRATDGVLGYFRPSEGSGDYTIMVYAIGGNPQVLSFDWVHISYDDDIVPEPSVELENNLLGMEIGNSIIDLTDENLDNNHSEILLTSPFEGATVQLTLYQGDLINQTDLSESSSVFAASLRIENGQAVLDYDGTDFTGSYLSDGIYTVHAFCYEETQRILLNEYGTIEVRSPFTTTENTILSATPSNIQFIPEIDEAPNVDINVNFTKPASFRLIATASEYDEEGNLPEFTILAEVENTRSFNISWDFKDAEGTLYEEVLSESSHTFYIIVEPLNNEQDWQKETEVVTVNRVTNIAEIEGNVFNIPANELVDGIWVPELKSDFKFTAIPKGEIKYYPKRKVIYQPRISGQQVLRYFPDVPWRVEYKKFLTSLELRAKGRYLAQAHKRCGTNTRFVNPSDVWPEAQPISFYTIEGDRDWDRSGLWTTNYTDITDAGSNIWYGDAPHYIEANVPPEVKDFHACSPEEFGNYNMQSAGEDYEKARCNVLLPSPKFTMNGFADASCAEEWSGLENGSIDISLYGISGGRKKIRDMSIYHIDMTNTGGNISEHHNNLVVPTFDDFDANTSPFKKGGGLDNRFLGPGERMFWVHRQGWMSYTPDYHKVDYDNWTQRLFSSMPYINWDHIYFDYDDDLTGTVNYFDYLRDAESFVQDEPTSWEVDNTSNTECEEGVNCIVDRQGRKFGQRGFVFRAMEDESGEIGLENRYGQRVMPWEYLHGYFDREEGFITWKYSIADIDNKGDKLRFNPIPLIKEGEEGHRRLLGVTFDTMIVDFPFTLLEDESIRNFYRLDRIDINRDLADRDNIKAIREEEGVTYIPASDQFEVILTPEFYASEDGRAEQPVACETVELSQYFPHILELTDVKNPEKFYDIVLDNSLSYDVDLASFVLTQDGYDDDLGIYVNYSPTSVRGEVEICYQNIPTVLSDWSAENDPTLEGTKGKLYGSGGFNEHGFRAVNAALDDDGFLGLVSSKNLDLEQATPFSTSPFHLDDDFQTVILNPNISPGSINWDLQVYYFDGESNNNALQAETQSSENFNLGLTLNSSPKNFVSIQGGFPEEITHNSTQLTFKSYSIYWIDSEGDQAVHSIPVNKFYREENAEPYVGTLYPDPALDFWNDLGSVSNLAYWDVTGKTGPFQLRVVINYQDNSEQIFSVIKQNEVQIGSRISDAEDNLIVRSTYGRASLSIEPPNIQSGDYISVYPISFSDLELNDNFPDVIPVGPVMQISSTGITEFNGGTLPKLSYMYSAEEIFTLTGNEDQWSSISSEDQIDEARFQEIYNYLESVKSEFKIHILSQSGSNQRPEALVTLGTVMPAQPTENRNDIYLKLEADIPHFSLAFVLMGERGIPEIYSAEASESNILIEGMYAPGFSADTIPNDLEIWIGTDRSLNNENTIFNGPFFPAVELDGSFRYSAELTHFQEGQNYIFARYVNSQSAARFPITIEPSELRISDVEVQPVQIQSVCGRQQNEVSFNANMSGYGSRQILNSNQLVLSTNVFEFNPGIIQQYWDGCIEGSPVADGVYYFRYIFPENESQNFSTAVGVGGAEVAHIGNIGVRYGTFYPSAIENHPHHQVISFSATQSVNISDLQVSILGENLQSASLDLSDLLSENENGFQVSWNGWSSGAPVPTGEYTVQVTLSNSILTPIHTSFYISNSYQSPEISLSTNPDQLVFPQLNAQVNFRTSAPINATAYLSNDLGMEQIGPTNLFLSGSHSIPFAIENSPNLPDQIVLNWETENGVSGREYLPLVWRPEVINISQLVYSPQDAIYPDITSNISRFFESSNSNQLTVSFISDRAATAAFQVYNNEGVVASQSIEVSEGFNSIQWNGSCESELSACDNELVVEGSYGFQLVVNADINAINDQVIPMGNIYVERLPDVLISWEVASTEKIEQVFIDSLVFSLNQLEVYNIEVANNEQTLEYMEYKPDGLVVFVDEVLSPQIFSGNELNRLSFYLREGGDLAFFNSLPLTKYQNEQGQVSPSLSASLSLYGFDSRFHNLESKVEDIFFEDLEVRHFDAHQSEDLTSILNSESNLSSQINAPLSVSGKELALRGRPQINKILWSDEIATYNTPISSFYLKPNYRDVLRTESGAFLTFYPFEAEWSGRGAEIAARDFANSIYRYFFAEDLSVVDINVANADAEANWIYRGSLVSVDYTLMYHGEENLEDVMVEFRDSLSETDVTVLGSMMIAALRPGSRQENFTFELPSNFAFNEHNLVVSVCPFNYTNEQGELVNEQNLGNNSLVARYLVADNSPPQIQLNELDESGNITPYYFSDLEGAYPLNLSGMISTLHGYEETQVELNIGATEIQLISYNESHQGLESNFNWEFDAYLEAITNGTVYNIEIAAQDFYGNTNSVSGQIIGDLLVPTITESFRPQDFRFLRTEEIELSTGLTNRYIYNVGNAPLVLTAQYSDESSIGLCTITTPLEEEIECTSTCTANECVLNQLIENANQGTYFLEIRDAAGNSTTSQIEVMIDVEEPSYTFFNLERTIFDALIEDTHVEHTFETENEERETVVYGTFNANSGDFIRNNPWYWFEIYDPNGEPIMAQVPTWDNRYASIISTSTFGEESSEVNIAIGNQQLLLTASDRSGIESIEVSIDGQEISYYSPYMDEGNDLYLANEEIRNAIIITSSQVYFEVNFTGTEEILSYIITDSAGNQLTNQLLLNFEERASTVVDPSGDASEGHQDFGEIYTNFHKKDENSTSLSFLIHSYEYWDVENELNYVYLDLDLNEQTGGSSGINLEGTILAGFEYRIGWSNIDSNDNIQDFVVLQEYSTQGWQTVSSESLLLQANKIDNAWTVEQGAGHAVLPSNRVAKAPGGIVEIGLIIEGNPDNLRWVVSGSSDNVFEISNNEAFVTQVKESAPAVKVDGFVWDWYGDEPPLLASSLINPELTSSWGEKIGESQVFGFDLSNNGLSAVSKLNFSYFLLLKPCEYQFRIIDDLKGWEIVSITQQQPLTYTNTEQTWYKLDLQIDVNSLTPGSTLRNYKPFQITGTCAEEFESFIEEDLIEFNVKNVSIEGGE